jgi:hypothetical protein
MNVEIVALTTEHMNGLSLPRGIDKRAYFSPGSVAFCLLSGGIPVFAGGIVNLAWNRGEAWVLPTPFFRRHLSACLRCMREMLPYMASEYGFERVQATCIKGLSAKLFHHLGFSYEGTMAKFGPFGETCDMYSRIFEVTP